MISIIIISKDEPSLRETIALVELQREQIKVPTETVVVDASGDRLLYIRDQHPSIRWISFPRVDGRVTIAAQRNLGVREAQGEIVVFTDSGCRPQRDWLVRLTAPILSGKEDVTAGLTLSGAQHGHYDSHARDRMNSVDYLHEAATINLSFTKALYFKTGGFDESFAYGSDIDFSWRLNDLGFRIASIPDAVVEHDWGSPKRQLKRSFLYGQARARLYRKHKARLRHIVRNDPVAVAYPVFLLGLPVTVWFPLYPFLLLIGLWRNREAGPVRATTNNLVFGAGIINELLRSRA